MALASAERIRAAVAAGSVLTPTGVAKITVSIGVAGTSDCIDLKTLLQHADQALYDAKRAGRACGQVFRPTPGYLCPTRPS